MDKLIYTALSATESASVHRVMLTNDLANISTNGFKRGSFQRAVSAKLEGPGFASRYQPIVPTRTDIVNMTEGPRIQTDNPLDVAMNDQTVLGVFSDDGQLAFTRRGDLRVSEAGFLQTANGFLVSTEDGGPLTVPVGGTVSVTPDGTIFFNQTQVANPPVPPQQIGQLLLRDASATVLQRRTDGLFEDSNAGGVGGDIAPGPGIPSITSGALEGSNVNPVEVLVNLMDFYRSFETQMKVIKSTEELDKDGTRLMRAS